MQSEVKLESERSVFILSEIRFPQRASEGCIQTNDIFKDRVNKEELPGNISKPNNTRALILFADKTHKRLRKNILETWC